MTKEELKNKCQRCGSDRIVNVWGKTSDLCIVNYKEYECDGYPPCDIGIDSEYDSDTLEFSYCLECGQIQDKWPKSDPDFSEDEGWYKEEELRRNFSE